MKILEACSPIFYESVCSNLDPSYDGNAPCLEILCEREGQRGSQWFVFGVCFDEWIYTFAWIYSFFMCLFLWYSDNWDKVTYITTSNFLLYVCVHDHTCVYMSAFVQENMHASGCACMCMATQGYHHQVSSINILHLWYWDKVFYLNLELADLAWLARQLVLGILPLPLILGLQEINLDFKGGAEKLNTGPHTPNYNEL